MACNTWTALRCFAEALGARLQLSVTPCGMNGQILNEEGRKATYFVDNCRLCSFYMLIG